MDLMETPSRILRRMADHDALEADVPSLPEFSMGMSESIGLGTSAVSHIPYDNSEDKSDAESIPDFVLQHPVQSTPFAPSHPSSLRSIKQTQLGSASSAASRVRFANSIMTRSNGSTARPVSEGSFDASRISHANFDAEQSLSSNRSSRSAASLRLSSRRSSPAHSLRVDNEISQDVAIVTESQPNSPSHSPLMRDSSLNKSYQDYQVSIRSESEVSLYASLTAHMCSSQTS